ncbi:cyclase family protein [bacterium]|nr:cyclase family protein [bacterium]
MRIYDISVPLGEGLPAYPGDPRVLVEPVLTLDRGDGANVCRITLAGHSGTHVDAPSHMLANGATLDSVPLSLLMGRALVADLRGAREIGPRELAGLPLQGEERLLLKTDNSLLWGLPGFRADYVSLNAAGAEFLLQAGIRLVGIDYLSIESFQGDGSVHRKLLGAGVVILEGLDLSAIEGGIYELICLPLRIPGADGAPARAVLRTLTGG